MSHLMGVCLMRKFTFAISICELGVLKAFFAKKNFKLVKNNAFYECCTDLWVFVKKNKKCNKVTFKFGYKKLYKIINICSL